MSRRERWGWGVAALLLLLLARAPLHLATAGLPVSNDDAIPLLMGRAVLRGELSTILWNQPYNGTLDAYLLAPGLAVASPHAAFRAYGVACGLALIVLTGLLAAAAAGERAGWMAAALAAAGTPYMAIMAALGPTPNFLVPVLVALVVLAGHRLGRGWSPRPAALGLVGLVAGLAVWDSFLALPALLGGAAGLALTGVRPKPRALAWITAGAAVGLLPLVIARATGASGPTPVTAVRPRWLWGAGLQDLVRAAQGLFGIEVPLVVDGPERGALPAAAAIVLAGALAAALLLGATRRRCLPLAGWAAALAVAFAFSRRTGGDEIRYLFGAAMPVLALCAAGIAGRLHGPPRPLTAALLAGLLVPWMIGHRVLLAAWRDPGHAAGAWQVPPLDAARERLRAAGARSAYASLQFAGRLTVESDGAVVASQAWNERIPGDPLRFRDEVDLDPAPAWVLSERLSRGMPRAAGFARLVAEMGGTFRQEAAGAVVVFHGFTPPYDETRPVAPGELSVRAMDGTALPTAVLDRDPATRWTSPAAIARGSGLVVTLASPRRLSAIVLAVGLDPSPLAVPWIAEADGAVAARGPARFGLQWVNGAPRAARQALLALPLGDREVREARVLFQDAGPRLEIAEVFAYGPGEPERPRAGAAAAADAYAHARQGRWDDAVRLYAEAVRLEPQRASHHAALARARWRAAGRRWLDVESLGDGGPRFVPRRGDSD
jgi:hypothetical protein